MIDAVGQVLRHDAKMFARGWPALVSPARPTTLREAVFALRDDPFFRDALGAGFVDDYVHIKNAEIDRFQAEVSEWEQREYFEMF